VDPKSIEKLNEKLKSNNTKIRKDTTTIRTIIQIMQNNNIAIPEELIITLLKELKMVIIVLLVRNR
jgi:hypothetical protein